MCVCMYVYMCMYVYIYIYMYTHIYIYIYMYVCIYVYSIVRIDIGSTSTEQRDVRIGRGAWEAILERGHVGP